MITPKVIPSTVLTASLATVLTCLANVRYKVIRFTLYNSDTSARTIEVQKIASGQTAGYQYTVVSALSLAAGETRDIDVMIGQMLDTGDFIQVKADVTGKVTVFGSYNEYTK